MINQLWAATMGLYSPIVMFFPWNDTNGSIDKCFRSLHPILIFRSGSRNTSRWVAIYTCPKDQECYRLTKLHQSSSNWISIPSMRQIIENKLSKGIV